MRTEQTSDEKRAEGRELAAERKNAAEAFSATGAEKRAEELASGRRRSAGALAAKIGMLAALSFLLSFLEFPIFPAAPFLKLDFSAAVSLVGGFALGPMAGVAVCFAKEALCLLKSSTGGVGEIANFVATSCFILVPSVAYRYRRTFSTALWSLGAGCLLQIAAATLCNRFVNFPLFMGEKAGEYFDRLWYIVIAFNAVKSAAISAVCLVTYKKAGALLRRFS